MNVLVRLVGLALLITAVGCGSVRDLSPGFEVDPAYFALGALYEYAGYPSDLSGGEIDTFDAGQLAEATVFVRFLERLAEEQAIDAEFVVPADTGGAITVASRPVRDYLVSLFPDPPPRPAEIPDLPSSPSGGPKFVYSSGEMFRGRESKLSWLAGVHLRFGRAGRLTLANSPHKVSAIRGLLVETGCTQIEVTQTPRGHYPVVYSVTYVPSPEIAALAAWVEDEVRAVREGGSPAR